MASKVDEISSVAVSSGWKCPPTRPPPDARPALGVRLLDKDWGQQRPCRDQDRAGGPERVWAPLWRAMGLLLRGPPAQPSSGLRVHGRTPQQSTARSASKQRVGVGGRERRQRGS